MSFFEDFASDAKVFANKASRQVNKTYEITKLKAERLRVKNKIDASYESLGELVYSSHKNGEDSAEEIEKIYAELDEDFARVEEIYQEIERVKTIYGSFDGEEEEYVEDVDDEEETEEAPAEEQAEQTETIKDDSITMDAD